MAGFIFSISSDENTTGVELRMSEGYYSALVPEKLDNIQSRRVAASVMADYCSMKEGDNVYFLAKRCLYGVGKLVNIGKDCKYKNYLRAHLLETISELKEDDFPLVGTSPRARWICFFQPADIYFSRGVDMDEVLSYRPESFRMLRAFQDRSFIKIDDEENQALKECIYLKNKDTKEAFAYSEEEHNRIGKLNLEEYLIDVSETISNEYKLETGEVNLEMILEAYFVDLLQKDGFGEKYDYVTHQVIASPFKPLEYIDKIDIFAYRFLAEFPNEKKPIEKYLIIEAKKGKANKDTLLQSMRYVDWVTQEYASGNYSLIKAVVIANKYATGLDKVLREQCVRSYISDTHPNESSNWNNLELLSYKINNNKVEIEKFDPFRAMDYLKETISSFGIEFSKSKKILIRGVEYKPQLKFANKKIAIFDKLNDAERKILKANNWKVLFVDEFNSREKILKLIGELFEV